MSNLYVTEPPTNGKVILTTNRGEIEIELWSREAPRASRNFVQLCLEGYYVDTIFHRIVTDFIIQGGDPSGTGTGGQSIYDEPFPDEFHSRLKYNRRGLVGMANNGKNDNGSQFFISLDSTPELQGKNTLFGRVMGKTIFNVAKIGQSEREEGCERPLYPARITKTEVIVNPFHDIQPRTTLAEREKRKAAQLKANAPTIKPVSKNKKLLSFADDGEDQEEAVTFKKPKGNKSSYDLQNDDRSAPMNGKPKTATRKRKITPPPEPIEEQQTANPTTKPSEKIKMVSRSVSPEVEPTKEQISVNKVQEQINALTSSLKRKKEVESHVKKEEPKLSHLEQQKAEYSRKALIGGRKKISNRQGFSESEVLAKLSQFQAKLSSSAPPPPPPPLPLPLDQSATSSSTFNKLEDEEPCTIHGVPGCMSCYDRLGELNDTESPANDTSWLSHSLVFASDKLGKNEKFKARAESELEVIDPREKAGQIALQSRREKRERDEKSGKNPYLQRDNHHRHRN